MDDLIPSRAKAKFAAAWLVVLAVLALMVGVWGTTLNGVLAVRAASSSVATSSSVAAELTFGARHTYVSGVANEVSPAAQAKCIYTQSDQGMLIVMSAVTGSILSPAQAANCTK